MLPATPLAVQRELPKSRKARRLLGEPSVYWRRHLPRRSALPGQRAARRQAVARIAHSVRRVRDSGRRNGSGGGRNTGRGCRGTEVISGGAAGAPRAIGGGRGRSPDLRIGIACGLGWDLSKTAGCWCPLVGGDRHARGRSRHRHACRRGGWGGLSQPAGDRGSADRGIEITVCRHRGRKVRSRRRLAHGHGGVGCGSLSDSGEIAGRGCWFSGHGHTCHAGGSLRRSTGRGHRRRGYGARATSVSSGRGSTVELARRKPRSR